MPSKALFLGAIFVLSACTFTRGDVDECTSDGDCQAAFGLGSTCGGEGLCDASPLDARCSLAFPTADAMTAETILLGTIVDGSLDTHVARARAVELAVRDASESGGIDGRTFGLVVCTNAVDSSFDGFDQDQASVHVAQVLRDVVGVRVIVGPPSSNATREVFGAVDNVLLISPSASSDDLTGLEPIPATDENPGRLWRTTAPDGPQAQRLAEDLVDRGITRLAIVHEAGSYGDGLAALVADALPASVAVMDFRYDTIGRLAELQGEVGRADAEEVLFISSRTLDTLDFLNEAARSSFYDDKTFLLTDAAANGDLLEELAVTIVDRIRGTRPTSVDDVTLDSFFARYQLTFSEDARPFLFASNAYDAGWLALFAIAWSTLQEDGAFTTNALGRGLRRVSEGARVPIRMSSWTTVLDAFRRGESVDLVGASGDLDFDPDTEETTTEFQIWVITGGVITPV